MSKINEIANRIMNQYSNKRENPHWNRLEPPPIEPYSQSEVWIIIDNITKEINSMLADKLMLKENN